MEPVFFLKSKRVRAMPVSSGVGRAVAKPAALGFEIPAGAAEAIVSATVAVQSKSSSDALVWNIEIRRSVFGVGRRKRRRAPTPPGQRYARIPHRISTTMNTLTHDTHFDVWLSIRSDRGILDRPAAALDTASRDRLGVGPGVPLPREDLM